MPAHSCASVWFSHAEHHRDVWSLLLLLLLPPLQIDRLYGWKSAPDTPVRDAFKRQKDFVMKEFEQRSEQVFLQLNEQVGVFVVGGAVGLLFVVVCG